MRLLAILLQFYNKTLLVFDIMQPKAVIMYAEIFFGGITFRHPLINYLLNICFDENHYQVKNNNHTFFWTSIFRLHYLKYYGMYKNKKLFVAILTYYKENILNAIIVGINCKYWWVYCSDLFWTCNNPIKPLDFFSYVRHLFASPIIGAIYGDIRVFHPFTPFICPIGSIRSFGPFIFI